jgi:molybdenum cofactor biosynthesis enzyme MoaA
MGQNCIISTLHFSVLDDDRLKREAFRQAVYYIDVETSSQCNRKCLYCPNSVNDRLSANQFMDDTVFVSFINDLHAIDYRRELHFVGYNEPLLYMEDVLGRIALARAKLPRATITVFTNGDYLEREGVDQLIAAGADEIKISVYLAPGRPYTDESSSSVSTRFRNVWARRSSHRTMRKIHEFRLASCMTGSGSRSTRLITTGWEATAPAPWITSDRGSTRGKLPA